MPCMPRTTRVFGVVKGVDEVRVLRSGRRLWFESGEGKVKKVMSENESVDCLGKRNKNDKKNEWDKYRDRDRNVKSRIGTKNEHDKFGAEVVGRKGNSLVSNSVSSDEKMFTLVYSRKRKRNGLVDQRNLCSHSLLRKKAKDDESLFELCVVVRERACNRFAYVLDLVLKYIKNFGIDFPVFAGFLLSEPVRGVFAEHGMHFSKTCRTYEAGVCKFFKAQSPLPMFYVDISAIPVCLMYMHLDLVCRVRYMSTLSVNKLSDLDECDEMSTDEEDGIFCIVKTIETKAFVSESDKGVLNPCPKASKLGMRNAHYKNGMSFHGVRRRRSSLRTRRARSPVVGIQKTNGVLASDLISRMKNGIPFSSVTSKNKPWRSRQRSSSLKIKEVSSSVTEVKQELHSLSCTANMLVVEADRCYRVEGATVILQVSDSGEWQLELKKGLTKYTHQAQKLMRPCSFNRITHDIIWKGDERWKLEFPDRQEWSVFKDLYKECFVRNAPSAPAPVSKAIPVPGVHEVLEDDESYVALFSRPDSYISVASDEVERALSKHTANYNMDCEDEMWLKQFNSEYISGAGQWVLSMDDFELIVDALEKSYFCAPDEFSDETALKLCAKFVRREVAETVYGYWNRKRKQKRGALLRVFQEHQLKKTPLVLKPTLRKKRSFNRKPSQFGRGKPPIFLQAITPIQVASEQQNALLKVEEAKLAAKRSIDAAILKRQKAQTLMDNAQLASYKAVMALRIAELSSIADNSSDAAVSLVLD